MSKAAFFLEPIGNAAMIMLVERTPPSLVQTDKAVEEVVTFQQSPIDLRLSYWFSGPAGGGGREETGEFIQPGSTFAFLKK